jgi:deoxyribose-phosphate aldolase
VRRTSSWSHYTPAVSTVVGVEERARDMLGVGRLTNRALATWLHGLPGVDQVGCEARAAALGTRSIKTTAKA